MEKIKTGIKGFDKITGGLPKESVIAVSGGVGTGKSTFGMQFLEEGIKNNNETGLYVSFEERKKPTLRHMEELGLNIKKLEEEKRLIFIEFPVTELDQLLEQEDAIKTMIETMDVKRVVIDPITPLGLLQKNELDKRQTLLQFISKVRNWKTTTILIAEDGKFRENDIPKTISGVENFTDGFIHLSNILEGRKRRRGLEIIKMRGCCYEEKIYDIALNKKGIEFIEPLIKKAKNNIKPKKEGYL
ncbi:MAG: ATPase domain-containing protein [Candidatus Micrarchaeia archaeon]|jgi:circadian clock protein KaiC